MAGDPFKLVGLVRPGDHLIWGQGTGEPVTITEAIVSERQVLGPLSVFVGAAFSDTLRPEHTDVLRVSSYGTLGTTRHLADASALEIIPYRASRLGVAVERREIPCDVAIVQLSRSGPNGKPSLGVINDYIRVAMARARVVIAEVNERLPWTFGPEPPALDRIALTVETSRPVVEVKSKPPTAVDREIASHVVAHIEDGATLQVGMGGTIDAVLQCLNGRRHLGIHSGTIGDAVIDLIEKGVVTNERKPIDTGIAMTAAMFGSERMFRFADRNPALAVHPYEYTHSAAVLARLHNLVALNSAIEVDLTGQANAEMSGGRYLGAVGGQLEFMHAGTRSPAGCSIIALPSTAAGGTVSRIRANVDVVTCPRSEVDFVVTEYGCAELRGQALRERIRRMIGIAHPDFREELERAAYPMLARGF
jgi:acyl-CoA hydrolase